MEIRGIITGDLFIISFNVQILNQSALNLQLFAIQTSNMTPPPTTTTTISTNHSRTPKGYLSRIFTFTPNKQSFHINILSLEVRCPIDWRAACGLRPRQPEEKPYTQSSDRKE